MSILEYLFFHCYRWAEHKRNKDAKALPPLFMSIFVIASSAVYWIGCFILWIDQNFHIFSSEFNSQGQAGSYSKWQNRFGSETLPLWLLMVGVVAFVYFVLAQRSRLNMILARFANSTDKELKVGAVLSHLYFIGSIFIPIVLISIMDFRPLMLVALILAYGNYHVSKSWPQRNQTSN